MFFNSSRRTRLLVVNALLFQSGWLLCILGGNLTALISLLILLPLHAWLFRPICHEWLLIAAVGLFGLVTDSLLIYFNLLSLEAFHGLGVATAPPWLICLWVLFGTTLCHSLKPLSDYPWLTVVFTIIGVPWAYWGGAYLKDVVLSWPGLATIAVIWTVWFPATMLYIVRKIEVNTPEK